MGISTESCSLLFLTGEAPLAPLMRRLLTGYEVSTAALSVGTTGFRAHNPL
jgi:hypothetical protein